MRNQETLFQVEEVKRQLNDLKLTIKGKDQTIQDLQSQLLALETSKMKDLDHLKSKQEEIKEANA